MAGVAPSVHTESMLATRIGASPSSGRAFFRPPPVSSRAARSSEMIRMSRSVRPALSMRLAAVGKGVDVDHRLRHARRGQAVEHMVDQRLAAHLHQGLWPIVRQRTHARAQARGQDHGCGERRNGGRHALTSKRHVTVQPRAQALRRRRGEAAVEIGPEPGHEGAVSRLGVADHQPGEEAQDAGDVQGAQGVEIGGERRRGSTPGCAAR